MKKRWILFAICLIAHTGLSLWLVTSGQFPKGYLYFFLVFFLLWEGLALILVPAKFASLSGMERWGDGICAAFTLLMGITLLIFPRFFGMLPPILIAGALGVELALAAVCLGVVYGSLRFLDQQEREEWEDD